MEVVELVVSELVGLEVEDEDAVVLDLEHHGLGGVEDGAGVDQPVEGMFEEQLTLVVVVVDGVFSQSAKSDQHYPTPAVGAELMDLPYFLLELVLVFLGDDHVGRCYLEVS